MADMLGKWKVSIFGINLEFVAFIQNLCNLNISKSVKTVLVIHT